MSNNKPLFTIRIVSQMTGAHPQTIRLYETKGLVAPQRSEGGTRLYSQEDVDQVQEIVELSAAGVTHEGIARIIALERKIHEMEETIDKLMDQNTQLKMALLKAQMQPPQQTAIVIRTTPLPPAKL